MEESGKASWRRSHPDPDGKPGRQKREKSVPESGKGVGGWVLPHQPPTYTPAFALRP